MKLFTKNLILIALFSMPLSVCFADSAVDAKVAEVKARMLRDFAPPKASQHLITRRRGASSSPSEEGINNPPATNEERPSSSMPSSGSAPSQSPRSWNYVQPGDTGPPPSNNSNTPSNGSSSESGFDHSHLY